LPKEPKQLKYLVILGYSTLPYQYQATTNDKGFFISGIPASTNPNLNFEIYIAQYGSQAAKPKRNFMSCTHVGCQRQSE
jgi:hypothetical protein